MRSLSNSELEEVVARLGELVSDGSEVPPSVACELLTHACRLYAAGPDPYAPDALAALRLSPTEACVVAAALLHSHSLTPFEFGVWFSNSRVSASDR